jgi:hypothetical protein
MEYESKYNKVNINQNLHIQNSFNDDNLKIIKIKNKKNYSIFKLITKEIKWMFWLIYLICILSIFVFFIANYFISNNNLKIDQKIVIEPQIVCNEHIKKYTNCYRIFNDSSLCKDESKQMTKCLDQVKSFRNNCYFYLSELNRCAINKNINIDFNQLKNYYKLLSGTSCKNKIENVQICIKENYPF